MITSSDDKREPETPDSEPEQPEPVKPPSPVDPADDVEPIPFDPVKIQEPPKKKFPDDIVIPPIDDIKDKLD